MKRKSTARTSKRTPTVRPPSRVVTSADIDRFGRLLGGIAGDLGALNVAWNTLYHHAATHGRGPDGDGLSGDPGRPMFGLWTMLSDYDKSAYDTLEQILVEWDEVMEPTLEQLLQTRLQPDRRMKNRSPVKVQSAV